MWQARPTSEAQGRSRGATYLDALAARAKLDFRPVPAGASSPLHDLLVRYAEFTTTGFTMTDGKTVLAVVPARGGSKGLPGKNILPFGGKPLLTWSFEAARSSSAISRIILSTEDQQIADVASDWGYDVPFLRPEPISRDDSRIADVLIHAMDNVGENYDFIMLLQPTSPLRTAEDIDNCFNLCLERNAPACVTITEPAKSPYWMFSRDDDGRLIPLFPETASSLRRQELLSTWVLNGAVYVAESHWYRRKKDFLSPETCGYVMPPSRSVDIDTAMDLSLAEMLLANAK